MKRTAILAVAVLLLPSAAAAQAMPPRVAGSANAQGITVTASAQARVPATSARIVLMLSTRDRSITLTTAKIQPLLDALAKAGIARENIHLPPSFDAPGGTTKHARLRNDSRDEQRHGHLRDQVMRLQRVPQPFDRSERALRH